VKPPDELFKNGQDPNPNLSNAVAGGKAQTGLKNKGSAETTPGVVAEFLPVCKPSQDWCTSCKADEASDAAGGLRRAALCQVPRFVAIVARVPQHCDASHQDSDGVESQVEQETC
jgi:hypothetical protein